MTVPRVSLAILLAGMLLLIGPAIDAAASEWGRIAEQVDQHLLAEDFAAARRLFEGVASIPEQPTDPPDEVAIVTASLARAFLAAREYQWLSDLLGFAESRSKRDPARYRELAALRLWLSGEHELSLSRATSRVRSAERSCSLAVEQLANSSGTLEVARVRAALCAVRAASMLGADPAIGFRRLRPLVPLLEHGPRSAAWDLGVLLGGLGELTNATGDKSAASDFAARAQEACDARLGRVSLCTAWVVVWRAKSGFGGTSGVVDREQRLLEMAQRLESGGYPYRSKVFEIEVLADLAVLYSRDQRYAEADTMTIKLKRMMSARPEPMLGVNEFNLWEVIGYVDLRLGRWAETVSNLEPLLLPVRNLEGQVQEKEYVRLAKQYVYALRQLKLDRRISEFLEKQDPTFRLSIIAPD